MVPTAFITAPQSFLVNIFTQRRFHSPANERGVCGVVLLPRRVASPTERSRSAREIANQLGKIAPAFGRRPLCSFARRLLSRSI